MADKFKELTRNRKAWHDFFIEETFEAGIELFGTEVKSMRMGRLNLKDSYVLIEKRQAILHGMHISPYDKGNIFNHAPERPRRLLLHRREIVRLNSEIVQKGFTLIPLRVYLKGGLVKVEIALAKGKKLYDRRDDMAKRDAQRQIERQLKDS